MGSLSFFDSISVFSSKWLPILGDFIFEKGFSILVFFLSDLIELRATTVSKWSFICFSLWFPRLFQLVWASFFLAKRIAEKSIGWRPLDALETERIADVILGLISFSVPSLVEAERSTGMSLGVFTGFYRVSLGWHCVLLDFTGFYWVLPMLMRLWTFFRFF